MTKKQVYAIAGPTASGKTSLSIQLAKKINAEIISVDSSLVYKHMDIGTAKPTIEEQDGIKHHMIDIVEPWNTYSVADYISKVAEIKKEIFSRDKEILFVGGTMLYFKALIEGLSHLPEADEQIRNILELEKKAKGLNYLYNKLKSFDEQATKKIHANDQQRIFRALEVIMLTGKRYSEISQTSKKGGLEEELKLVALVPENRSTLHKNIEIRFHQMIKQGFIDELETLKNMENFDKNMTSMRSVGYRQGLDYLDDIISYEDFINKGIVATRQLAKRQLTWLRNWDKEIYFQTIEDNNNQKIDNIINFFKL